MCCSVVPLGEVLAVEVSEGEMQTLPLLFLAVQTFLRFEETQVICDSMFPWLTSSIRMLKVPSVLNLKPNILCIELGQKCPSFP